MSTLTVTEPAVGWLKKEMNLHAGDAVRFYARYGGCGSVQSGFSLGLQKEQPHDIGTEFQENDITFFMKKDDLWYLDDRDLIVDYDPSQDELRFVVSSLQ